MKKIFVKALMSSIFVILCLSLIFYSIYKLMTLTESETKSAPLPPGIDRFSVERQYSVLHRQGNPMLDWDIIRSPSVKFPHFLKYYFF